MAGSKQFLTGAVVLACTLLFSSWVVADDSSDTESVLREADLFHSEYRQNLASGLEDAILREERAENSRELALALVYEARYRRLRGEFATGLARVNEAGGLPGLDPLTEIRILVERRWIEVEQASTPWGESIDRANDFSCHFSGFSEAGDEYDRARGDLDTRLIWWPDSKFGKAAFLESMGLAMWQRTYVDVGFQVNNILFSREKSNSVMLPNVRGFLGLGRQTVGGMGKYFVALPDARIRSLRTQAIGVILSAADAPDAAKDLVNCDLSNDIAAEDKYLQSHIALACAQMCLFPGGVTETLALSPRAPGFRESQWSASSELYEGANLRRSLSKGRREQGLTHLARAEDLFRISHNDRGLARVAYVRMAEQVAGLLAAELPPSLEDCRQIEEPSSIAITLAERTGDTLLLHRAVVLQALMYALVHDAPSARAALAPLIQYARTEHAWGVVVGAARWFGLMSIHQHTLWHDTASSEILSDLVMSLYDAVGFHMEASDFAHERGRVLVTLGEASKATAVFREATNQVNKSCADHEVQRSKQRVRVQSELGFLCFDLADKNCLEAVVANLKSLSLELAGNTSPKDIMADTMAHMVDDTFLDESLGEMQAIMSSLSRKETSKEADERLRKMRRLTERQKRRSDAQAQRHLLLSMAQSIWIFNGLLARLKDKDELLSNPDLLADKRYARWEESLAGQQGPQPRRARATIAAWRGDKTKAKELWISGATDQLDSIQRMMGELGINMSARSRMDKAFELAADARAATRIGLPDEAGKYLQEVELLLGSPTWYLDKQEPWQEMITYVDTRSAQGNHVESLSMSRKMLELVDARRGDAVDERHRASFFGNPATTEPYASAVMAAVRAGDAESTLEFMERGKARTLQESLLAEPSPEQARFRERGQAILILQQIVSDDRCQGEKEGPCQRAKQELARENAEYDRLLANSTMATQGVADYKDLVARIGAGLSNDSMLLSYFLTSDGVAVLGILPTGKTAIALTGELPSIVAGRVRRLDSALVRRLQTDTVQRDAEELSRLLFPVGPVRDMLAVSEIRELIVVPNGALHEVPFAMLPFDGKPLVDKFRIRVLPSAQSLLSNAKPIEGKDVAVAFYEGDDPNDRLGFARAEAARVADVHGVGAERLKSRKHFLDLLQTRSGVHLIAHGISSPERGPLAQVDLPRQGDDGGDLQVSDLLLFPKPFAARWVVLSSCELAMGRQTPGDDGVGIPRALLQKGVGTIIGSLWRVEDAIPTMDFMYTLHRKLQEKDTTPVAALAAAQREAIGRGAEPTHWASWLAIGGAR